MFIAATVLLMAFTPALNALADALGRRLPAPALASAAGGGAGSSGSVPGAVPAGAARRTACRCRGGWCSPGTARTPASRPAP
ncbi:hypothetical protein [Deinococcus aquaticus]|uniref:hypothetical protein n=1 Tax=Deinococcus aquaticus TaxID=328692 RepID=UPI003613E0FA